MASSRRGMLCPSARTRRGLAPASPWQMLADGKLESASTSLSPCPMLASACSSSGDSTSGTPFNTITLKCS